MKRYKISLILAIFAVSCASRDINRTDAQDIARQVAIRASDKRARDNPIVVDHLYTQERSYGWIFAINSEKFIKTGDINFVVIGNTRFVVTKLGKVCVLSFWDNTEGAISKRVDDAQECYTLAPQE